jgi:FkbM family methyltransferase
MLDKSVLPFLMDTSSDIPRFRADTFWTKEPETIEWIQRNLTPGTNIGVFVDVGANVGIYSLFASVVSRRTQIIAVEPLLINHDELVRNINVNKKESQINPIHAALSRKSGIARLLNNDFRVGSSGAQIDLEDSSIGIQVPVKTGDEVLSSEFDRLVKNSEQAMIKIDTDGNELDVLLGFSETFDRGLIATVLVETHPSNRDGIEEYMRAKNFCEAKSFLDIEGHSNHRRAEKGNSERTKIYSPC